MKILKKQIYSIIAIFMKGECLEIIIKGNFRLIVYKCSSSVPNQSKIHCAYIYVYLTDKAHLPISLKSISFISVFALQHKPNILSISLKTREIPLQNTPKTVQHIGSKTT